MARTLSDSDLEAYLDEALAPPEMAAIEAELRRSPRLLEQLAEITGRRDAGTHSVGEIWRRHRISCPTREQMGSYLLGVLEADQADYLRFHLKTVGCRFCLANLEDLQRWQAESRDVETVRRSKYYDSSARYLNRRDR